MTDVSRIEDYAVIGDGRSAALVSRAGSIDWLCWPRFDSPSIFGAILDPRVGGHWSIAPAQRHSAARRYVDASNVLVTEFATGDALVRLTDLMPVFSEEAKKQTLVPEHEILRIVECVHGEAEVVVRFEPRPNYGRDSARLRPTRGLGLRVEDGPRLYTLRSDAPLEVRSNAAGARLRLKAGERRHFSLSYDEHGPAVLPPLGAHSEAAVRRTVSWWQEWANRCTYQGPHRDRVVRSLLVLKLLAYAPSGAIVAAPTTSLPERIGGDLNWDYRFCWIRDASLTVHELLDLGYPDEAAAFVSWLLHGTRLTRPRLRVLYDVYGELPKREETLDHLEGHRGSRPVRIRNAATDQIQLDTYGEVIDAVSYLCRRAEPSLDAETRSMLREFGEYACKNWQRPDQGIWEPRTSPRHYTHSRVLCWTALDRLLELHRGGALPRLPAAQFEHNRALIERDIEAHSWSDALGAYTQFQGGDTVDASLLLLGWYGFKAPSSARMRATYQRIRERLEVRPGLLYRYEESAAAGEGAFGICSFWAAEYLARGGGSLDEAEAWFEALLPYANDVGLLAEEIDPVTGEPLGNVPQAFTHVGLISAALAIEERRKTQAASAPLRQERRVGDHDAEVHP